MEPVLEPCEQQAVVVDEEQPVAAVTQAAEEADQTEELVELLLREITIDGMCGVY
ncbi:mycofactocin precursor MftA [Thermomicrobium sp. 4228-Ro]|uniref:mycofactocin precursor MftA n=1 Tax=Thermomicrobium sp. 4228-Ro TaxID=2993937 RepID=UPI00224901AC|nr:mycofactocin precursor MftA [Thermomicrobium sp. 4228-Ro]MCX2727860.1 mycofactocin precursor MftA [Thermomicrobium sp. 4228-Ro]